MRQNKYFLREKIGLQSRRKPIRSQTFDSLSLQNLDYYTSLGSEHNFDSKTFFFILQNFKILLLLVISKVVIKETDV